MTRPNGWGVQALPRPHSATAAVHESVHPQLVGQHEPQIIARHVNNESPPPFAKTKRPTDSTVLRPESRPEHEAPAVSRFKGAVVSSASKFRRPGEMQRGSRVEPGCRLPSPHESTPLKFLLPGFNWAFANDAQPTACALARFTLVAAVRSQAMP